jgi:hypothetical protein
MWPPCGLALAFMLPPGVGAGFYLGYSWLPSFFVKHAGVPPHMTLWMTLSGMVLYTFVVPVRDTPGRQADNTPRACCIRTEVQTCAPGPITAAAAAWRKSYGSIRNTCMQRGSTQTHPCPEGVPAAAACCHCVLFSTHNTCPCPPRAPPGLQFAGWMADKGLGRVNATIAVTVVAGEAVGFGRRASQQGPWPHVQTWVNSVCRAGHNQHDDCVPVSWLGHSGCCGQQQSITALPTT